MRKRRLEKRNTLIKINSSEGKIKTVKGKTVRIYHTCIILNIKDTIRRKRDPIKLLDDPLDLINSHKKKKEKKKYERDRKYYKEVKEKKSKSKSSSSSSSSIEELRAKRLERERNEKLRVKRLYLEPNMTEEIDKGEEEELDDRKRGYNSQFNREETSEAKSKRNRRY